MPRHTAYSPDFMFYIVMATEKHLIYSESARVLELRFHERVFALDIAVTLSR